MNHHITRKRFFYLAAGASAGAALAWKQTLLAQSPPPGAQVSDKPPPLDRDLVKEFVIAGHGNLGRTKELLEKTPGLLNACWDWGGGDFETALEGAGHMGNKDIAVYLLGEGARMNIFCAAMLGKLDVVKALLTAFPDLKTSKGPHGLQLLHHAGKGGAEAQAVLDYLKSVDAQ